MVQSKSLAPLPDTDAWLERLLQLLHDPPGKVKYLSQHKKLSHELAEAIADLAWSDEEWEKGIVNRPDAAAAGADRPSLPWAAWQHFNKASRQVVTHPLGRREDAPLLQLSTSDPPTHVGKAGQEERRAQREAAKRLASADLVRTGDCEGAFYRVWRRFREELIAGEASPEFADPKGTAGGTGAPSAGPESIEGVRTELFWSAVPADTRCPDVSIWDHTRVTAALSFMNVATSTQKKPTTLDPAREPWLLQVSLSGIQRFIRTARTSRDLWVGSFLLSDLAFHAMLPIIEQYGATAILYPDLWRNPRMDAWLAGRDGAGAADQGAERRRGWECLPKYTEPTSFAAVIPNSFVAVVPFGGEDGLPGIRDLAEQSRHRVAERWATYAALVRDFLRSAKRQEGQEGSYWERIWHRQHGPCDVVRVRWSAVPWELSPRKMDAFVQAGALPWQDRAQLPQETDGDSQRRLERDQRLSPWISTKLWEHSERTRYAFGRTNPHLLQMERGFDYCVTQAQLRAVHEIRKQAAIWPEPRQEAEGGTKCSLCGERSALTESPGSGRGAAHVDTLTSQARGFWKDKGLDPEERGAERLCGVCAAKRFLVEAGGLSGGINALWANEEDQRDMAKEGSTARVPFPSTTAICAQRYLAAICRSDNPTIREAIGRVVTTHRALRWPRTQFPRCLRQLAEAYHGLPEGDERREFLQREPQELLYPNAIDAHLRRQGHADRDRLDAVGEGHLQAVRALLAAVQKKENGLQLSPPTSRLAVIKIDGDSLSSLLTGEPERLHARWQDVLHPELVEKLRDGSIKGAEAWQGLLSTTRMMGPSLHAFVTRALGEFAHRIAPWVVEQEFHGRVIYVGGDDLLALAPADEALGIAARLQQLYSASWVVDTRPQCDAWAWRRLAPNGESLNGAQARERFQIPVPEPGPHVLTLPAAWVEGHAAEHCGQDWDGGHLDTSERLYTRMGAPTQCVGPVIPMLGRGQSLSAGIVYAHFKDSLGGLVAQAQELVDDHAKAGAGRGAVAFAWRSRGGEKSRFTAPWSEAVPLGASGGAERSEGSPQSRLISLADSWNRVVCAFQSGKLSKGLPYKLRERAKVAQVVAHGGVPEMSVLERLVRAAAPGLERDEALSGSHPDRPVGKSSADASPSEPDRGRRCPTLAESVAALWRSGFRYSPSGPEAAASGLAICRQLAGELSKGDRQ